MRRLPHWMQWLLTEMTGKALAGHEPPFRWSRGARFALSLTVLAAGMGLSLTALLSGGAAWLLLPGWMLTVSAMRTWQTSFLHHAAHGNFLRPEARGSAVAELLSTLIWIQPLTGYRPEHVLHHRRTATSEDADLRFLAELGFRPGMTEGAYWRQLAGMMVSPLFHLKYAWFRLRANFVKAPPVRRAVAVAWTLAAAAAAVMAPLPVLLLWIVPAWPLYQIAGLLQLLTEHNWVRIGDGRDRPRTVMARLTNARYLGEALPAEGCSRMRMVRWWLRMMVIHLPQRLFVIQGDLPSHDWHHRDPRGDWANAAYARRGSAADANWPLYTEVWGTGSALRQTFRLLAALPADAELGKPLTYGDLSEGLLGM